MIVQEKIKEFKDQLMYQLTEQGMAIVESAAEPVSLLMFCRRLLDMPEACGLPCPAGA
jgi:hypothetical protein